MPSPEGGSEGGALEDVSPMVFPNLKRMHEYGLEFFFFFSQMGFMSIPYSKPS